MNLLVKYGPIRYTLFRNNQWNFSFSWIMAFMMENFVLPFLVLSYLYFSEGNSFFDLLLVYIIFCICFLIFSIWYELWYLYNDTVSIKKEKKPTIRIPEKYSSDFIILSFVIRVILWILWVWVVFLINTSLWIHFLCLVILMLAIYHIHNKVRKLEINYFTIIFLRLTKFCVFMLVVFCFFNQDFLNIFIPLFSFFFLRELININWIYNIKFWGKNAIDILIVYINMAICQFILFLWTKNTLYCALIFYLFITILHLWVLKINTICKKEKDLF